MGPGIRVDTTKAADRELVGATAAPATAETAAGAGDRLDCVAANPRPPAGRIARKPGAGETMNREEKSATIQEIAAQIEGSEAIFAVDYRGISVPQAAELRSKLREADASFRIVKNRLTKLAADKAGEERLAELLQGPTALTFVRGDTAQAAKAITTFNKEHDVLTYKGGFMDATVARRGQLQIDRPAAVPRSPHRPVRRRRRQPADRPRPRPRLADPGPGLAARPDRRAGAGHRRGSGRRAEAARSLPPRLRPRSASERGADEPRRLQSEAEAAPRTRACGAEARLQTRLQKLERERGVARWQPKFQPRTGSRS